MLELGWISLFLYSTQADLSSSRFYLPFMCRLFMNAQVSQQLKWKVVPPPTVISDKVIVLLTNQRESSSISCLPSKSIRR